MSWVLKMIGVEALKVMIKNWIKSWIMKKLDNVDSMVQEYIDDPDTKADDHMSAEAADIIEDYSKFYARKLIDKI